MLKRLDNRPPPPDPLFWRGVLWGLLFVASVTFIVGMLFT